MPSFIRFFVSSSFHLFIFCANNSSKSNNSYPFIHTCQDEITALEERLAQLKLDLVAKSQSLESAVYESDFLERRLSFQKRNVVHLVLALVLRDGWIKLDAQPVSPAGKWWMVNG